VILKALDQSHGWEIWTSNGRSTGTRLLKDFVPGYDLSNSTAQALGGVALVGSSDGAEGIKLWRTNGTRDGTTLLAHFSFASSLEWLANVPDLGAFFTVGGVWLTDGTSRGTRMINSEVRPGLVPQDQRAAAAVGDRMFFCGDVEGTGRELWTSDGTSSGTTLVMDINPVGSSEPAGFVEVDGIAYFAADDGAHGRQLWRSDGTPGGTRMVVDLGGGADGSWPRDLTSMDGRLYFVAWSETGSGWQLWRTDGTVGGTERLTDFVPNSWNVGGVTVGNGVLFFVANDGVHGFELWASDGTRAGTRMVADHAPGPDSGIPPGTYARPTWVGDRLLLAAYTPAEGLEPWQADVRGFGWLADVNPGPASSMFSGFVAAGDSVFFGANDGERGSELWATPSSARWVSAAPTALGLETCFQARSRATVRVSLSKASPEAVVVQYATADGNALAGIDYVAVSGTITFPPGSTEQTVAIAITDDEFLEKNETFYLELNQASGALIENARTTITILDREHPGP
jgi:ELWxxDGT repeat protein